MKTIRKDYPRVRQYVKSGNTYFQVDLRRKHYQGPKWKNFTDRQAALKYASDVAEKVSKDGLTSISAVGTDPRISAWTEQFAIYDKTLEDAISVALAVFEKERKVKESPFMAELLTLWIDDKTTGLRKLRPRSLKTIRNMANIYKTDFGMVRIKEIDQQRIEDYLKGKDVSDQYRENIRNYLSQFFNWCIKKKYHNQNPAEEIEIEVNRGSPGFFTVQQCEAMMTAAMKDEHRAMTAYFALCLFGGIRPDEVARMTWGENVKMDTKEIFLQVGITKTKKERIFKMSDNLFAWIEFCKDVKPLVPASNIQNQRVRLCKDLNFPWIADGLRHTFATFHYAEHKSFEELRHIMGNSPGIIDRFYKGAISHAALDKFWSITPANLQKSN
jgi:integrase